MTRWAYTHLVVLIVTAVSLVFCAAPAEGQSQLPTCRSAMWHMCYGAHIFPSGEQYVGEWRDNKFHGQGTYSFPSGEKYIGDFRDHQRNGQGTHILPNGEKYVGEFRDGKRNGQGSRFSASGRLLQQGTWVDNAFVPANNQVNRAVPAQRAPSPPPPPTATNSGTSVRLIRDAGTFKVPVRINGVLELQFTVDSGASDVTIPADVVMTLIRTGTIRDSDFVGEQTYRLADGSTVKSRTFRIRQLQVGSRTIENVLGSVANVEGSLLLGQSFLSTFRRVSFDYAQGVLVLE